MEKTGSEQILALAYMLYFYGLYVLHILEEYLVLDLYYLNTRANINLVIVCHQDKLACLRLYSIL